MRNLWRLLLILVGVGLLVFTGMWLGNREVAESDGQHDLEGRKTIAKTLRKLEEINHDRVVVDAMTGSDSRLVVQVVDERSVPIKGASVYYTRTASGLLPLPDELRTNESGEVAIAGTATSAWLLCAAEGYSSCLVDPLDNEWDSIAQEGARRIVVELSGPVPLLVTVEDTRGAPVVGATVFARSRWGQESRSIDGDSLLAELLCPEGVTDNNGNAHLTLHEQVEYELVCKADGYSSYRRVLTREQREAEAVLVVLNAIVVAGIAPPQNVSPLPSSGGEHTQTVFNHQESGIKRGTRLHHDEERGLLTRLEARLGVSNVTWFTATEIDPTHYPVIQEVWYAPWPGEPGYLTSLQFKRVRDIARSDIYIADDPVGYEGVGEIRVRFASEGAYGVPDENEWVLMSKDHPAHGFLAGGLSSGDKPNDERDYYSFRVPPGRYVVGAAAGTPGGAPFGPIEVQVATGATEEVEVPYQGGSVTRPITVVDSLGRQLFEWTLSIRDIRTNRLTRVESGSSRRTESVVLTIGRYEIKARAFGYCDLTTEVVFDADTRGRAVSLEMLPFKGP